MTAQAWQLDPRTFYKATHLDFQPLWVEIKVLTRSWVMLDGLDGLCDNVHMKNITVSIRDDLYHRARVRAAELGTSVSAVVRDYLTEFVGGETDFERRRRLQDETLASIAAFRASERLSREEVHERDAFR